MNEVSIDEQAALSALEGNRQLLKELASMFAEDAPKLISSLIDAVASNDCMEARRTVHSLKGLGATFYAESFVELASRLEREAADGRIESLRQGGIRQLEESAEALRANLREHGLLAK